MEAAHVTEDEIRQAFIDTNERVTVGAIIASYDKFAATVPEPSAETLQTYLADHTEDFQVGARVVLDIVKISKDPSEFDRSEAKAKIQMIYDSVTTGSDFVEFAQIYSDDPGSGAAGGDLGWFKKGRMVKEFDSAAFAMRDGEISVPIQTNFGWHVLKHQGYRGEGADREAHVSHILVKAMASDQTLTSAWDRLEALRSYAETIGLDSAAVDDGLTMFTTGGIERKGYIAHLGVGAPVLEWAFEAEKGAISEVMDLPNTYAVVKVADKLPAGVADFESVRGQVLQAYTNGILEGVCRDTAAAVYTDIQKGDAIKSAAEKHGLAYEELPSFGRGSNVSKLANDPFAVGAAFGLSEVGRVSGPIDFSGGTVIFKLISRTSPDLTVYNESRDSLYTTLLNTKKQQAFSAWYTDLADNAIIENNFSFRRR